MPYGKSIAFPRAKVKSKTARRRQIDEAEHGLKIFCHILQDENSKNIFKHLDTFSPPC